MYSDDVLDSIYKAIWADYSQDYGGYYYTANRPHGSYPQVILIEQFIYDAYSMRSGSAWVYIENAELVVQIGYNKVIKKPIFECPTDNHNNWLVDEIVGFLEEK